MEHNAAPPPAQSPLQAGNPTLIEHVIAIRQLGKRVVADVVEIGGRLTECKRILGHGNWLPWLEREFGWTEQTALNFMRVAELSKSKTVLDLDLPVKALYLLAAPSTPAEVRDEIIARAESGEPVSVGEVKETIAQLTRGRKKRKRRRPRARFDAKPQSAHDRDLDFITTAWDLACPSARKAFLTSDEPSSETKALFKRDGDVSHGGDGDFMGAKAGEEAEKADDVSTVDTRIDTKGRKQSTAKGWTRKGWTRERYKRHRAKKRLARARARSGLYVTKEDGKPRPATKEEYDAFLDAGRRAIAVSGVGCGTSELLSNPIAGAWRRASPHQRDVFVRHWAADLRQIMKEIAEEVEEPEADRQQLLQGAAHG